MTTIAESIRTVKSHGTTYYLVNDLIKNTGSTKTVVMKTIDGDVKKMLVPTTVGKATVRVYHNVVNSRVAKRVISAAVAPTTKKVVTKVTQTKVAKTIAPKVVENKVDTATKTLQNVVRNVLTKANLTTIGLHLTGKSATVRNEVREIESRRAIRKTIETFIDRVADELEITDKDQKSTLFDIAYQTLYSQYKRLTKVDLKEKAEQQNTSGCGDKISALQMAEQLGVAEELFNLAKLVFNKQN